MEKHEEAVLSYLALDDEYGRKARGWFTCLQLVALGQCFIA